MSTTALMLLVIGIVAVIAGPFIVLWRAGHRSRRKAPRERQKDGESRDR